MKHKFLPVLLCCLLLLCGTGIQTFALGAESSTSYNGVDVSQ